MVPALVVSPGPSLRRNWNEIADLEVTLAVGSPVNGRTAVVPTVQGAQAI